MISFFLNTCLPALGINIETITNDIVFKHILITQKIVNEICTNTRKYRWFKLFCEAILGIENIYEPSNIVNISDEHEYISGDMHVICSDELDKIYIESKKNTLDELVFLLLITTGMRIGGMLNIRIPHVCTIDKNEVKVFDTGRTLEKGCKWFDFVINDKVKELITRWIMEERRGGTDYLFSSGRNSGKNMASITMRVRFKKLCENAGLNGRHLHLHSLRHSYAHMLLKCGNSVSVISKLLNHSSTDVTEKFYLRETISEVTNRAHIPWLNQNEKNEEKILPDFLRGKENKNSHKMKRLEYLSAMCG
jgi:integrase